MKIRGVKENKMECILCHSDNSRKLFDGPFYTLHLCLSCGSNFQERHNRGGQPPDYDEEYFKSGHTRAYGRTYIGDEQNIREISRRRLRYLRKIVKPGGRLLDIGSAMGLFCDEARAAGLSPEGLEISGYAREFSSSTFNIKVWRDIRECKGSFDAATLWFTLEHMDSPAEWINNVRLLLNDGGVIAVSAPNSAGAFARFNPGEYYRKRPPEHLFEPSPHAMKDLLERSGFHTIRIEYFGLHPERISLPQSGLFKIMQKIAGLGDTFEIYAKKV